MLQRILLYLHITHILYNKQSYNKTKIVLIMKDIYNEKYRIKCLRTFCIQQPGNAQFILGNIEGIVEVANVVGWSKCFIFDDIWSMGMDKSVKSQSIPPAAREILDVDTSIPEKIKLIHNSILYTIRL